MSQVSGVPRSIACFARRPSTAASVSVLGVTRSNAVNVGGGEFVAHLHIGHDKQRPTKDATFCSAGPEMISSLPSAASVARTASTRARNSAGSSERPRQGRRLDGLA